MSAAEIRASVFETSSTSAAESQTDADTLYKEDNF